MKVAADPARRGSPAGRAVAAGTLLAAAACGIPRVPALPEPGTSAADTTSAAATAGLIGMPIAPDCFRRHLRDAIALNEARRATYAAWSDGASEPVTDRLVSAEEKALLAAWLVDRRSAPFREAGVPIGCAEFAPMELAPALEPERPPPPAAPPRPGPDADSLGAALLEAYGAGGFPAVRASAESLLLALADQPGYHCMIRHIAESIARVAVLAPAHAHAAAEAGLPSTIPISELLLRLHLAALPDAAALDRDARPLQARGVPILCRDVPPLYPLNAPVREGKRVPDHGGRPTGEPI